MKINKTFLGEDPRPSFNHSCFILYKSMYFVHTFFFCFFKILLGMKINILALVYLTINFPAAFMLEMSILSRRNLSGPHLRTLNDHHLSNSWGAFGWLLGLYFVKACHNPDHWNIFSNLQFQMKQEIKTFSLKQSEQILPLSGNDIHQWSAASRYLSVVGNEIHRWFKFTFLKYSIWFSFLFIYWNMHKSSCTLIHSISLNRMYSPALWSIGLIN